MEKTNLDEKLPVVKVHATVLFSILNHFMRRKEDRKDMRVVGSILGVISHYYKTKIIGYPLYKSTLNNENDSLKFVPEIVQGWLRILLEKEHWPHCHHAPEGQWFHAH